MTLHISIYAECFNSRTREGATSKVMAMLSGKNVSIHAPVRVRPTACNNYCILLSFNSRTREGATFPEGLFQNIKTCFNSRTREGATLYLL